MTITRDKLLDIDDLAQFIRSIDGNHSLGAGALAEKICERFAALLSEAQEGGRMPPAGYRLQPHAEFDAMEHASDQVWNEAAEWLRNNYQEYANIADLCDAMRKRPLQAQQISPMLSVITSGSTVSILFDSAESARSFADRTNEAARAVNSPLQAQEPTNGELLRAIQGTIPLVEPVHITKALRAGRKAQVCLSGGTGPLACVMLVNIQLTPWIHSEDTAKAFADGYNRALEQHRAALLELIKNFEARPSASCAVGEQSFQQRVQPWMMACFGAEISGDCEERNHRFFEESTELVRACGMTVSEAHQLVDYVYGRPVGEKPQEVGGVMVTLAALCLAQGLDMHECGEIELARIWMKVEQIRAKQAAKPKHSPLPEQSA